MNHAFSPTVVRSLRALNDSIIVCSMDFKHTRSLSSGIILPHDDGKAAGIRPRWGQVYAVGPLQHDVVPGQWVCVAHGRWTRGVEIEDLDGVKTIRRIDPADILLLCDEAPSDDTLSDAIQPQPKKSF